MLSRCGGSTVCSANQQASALAGPSTAVSLCLAGGAPSPDAIGGAGEPRGPAGSAVNTGRGAQLRCARAAAAAPQVLQLPLYAPPQPGPTAAEARRASSLQDWGCCPGGLKAASGRAVHARAHRRPGSAARPSTLTFGPPARRSRCPKRVRRRGTGCGARGGGSQLARTRCEQRMRQRRRRPLPRDGPSGF